MATCVPLRVLRSIARFPTASAALIIFLVISYDLLVSVSLCAGHISLYSFGKPLSIH